MRQARNGQSPRRGFTLIELLVVIAIIAVLVGLLLAGVMKVYSVTPRVQTGSELGQLSGAMGQFRQDFNVDYIPSRFVLRKDFYDTGAATNPWGSNSAVDHRRAVGYLTKLFGKNIFRQDATNPNRVWLVGPTGNGIDWNGQGITANQPDTVLTGEQCLVFFLGGIQTSAGPQCLGFAKDPANPAAPGGVQRWGPYYQFKPQRLVAGNAGYFMYQDPYSPRSGTLFAGAAATTFYAYFAANKGVGTYDVASSQNAAPYVNSSGTPIKPDSFQIICAGQDGLFGSVTGNPAVWDKQGTNNINGRDDQASFASGLVGASN
jgi:prepilin-type N-terminal cleavage/methylation domain-containing protein